MKKIIIVGAGGHGKVILNILEKIRESKFDDITIEGFLDDGKKGNFLGYDILGSIKSIDDLNGRDTYFILAIGSNEIRKNIDDKYNNIKWYRAVDIDAIVAYNVIIGEGTVVMPGAIINADATIGRHCIVNTGAIIEHDCSLGAYTHVSPGSVVTGGCKLGDLVQIGARSVLNPGVEVCSNVIVGSGTVVIKSITESGVYVGLPSRKIRDLE